MAFTSKYGLFSQEELKEMFTVDGKELKSDICLIGFIIDSRNNLIEIGLEIDGVTMSFPTEISISQLETIDSNSELNQKIELTKDLIKKVVKSVNDQILAISEVKAAEI